MYVISDGDAARPPWEFDDRIEFLQVDSHMVFRDVIQMISHDEIHYKDIMRTQYWFHIALIQVPCCFESTILNSDEYAFFMKWWHSV